MLLTISFYHDASQRFCARIPQKQSSPIAEMCCDLFRQSHDAGDFRERSFLANAYVDEHLRKSFKASNQFSEGLVVVTHRAQQSHSRDHSITSQTQAWEDDVTGLFATHYRPRPN